MSVTVNDEVVFLSAPGRTSHIVDAVTGHAAGAIVATTCGKTAQRHELAFATSRDPKCKTCHRASRAAEQKATVLS